MTKTNSISRKPAELQSMQYRTLRDLGVKHLETLAGKLWTDYNSHDPGVTMLEALAYAITDLGYRISYDIKDILAQDLTNPGRYDIKNFYTAHQILPNCPLTISDYRKVIIDVDLEETINGKTIRYGVRNAWVKCSDKAECGIYVDAENSLLSLEPKFAGQAPYYVRTLYDVLLEFSDHELYGDLNENTLTGSTTEQDGVEVELEVEFPRWDETEVDWTSPESIRSRLRSEHIRYHISGLPSNYRLEINYGNGGLLEPVSDPQQVAGGLTFVLDGAQLQANLEQLLDEMTLTYIQKVNKIFEIIEAIKARLHAHRNLCDDWFQFQALKVEEILLCADIELKPEADVETVEANTLHAVYNFLAPKVYFYTIEEMLNRSQRGPHYLINHITRNKRTITISNPLEEDINGGDTITLLDAGTNSGEFTVKCIKPNRENARWTDVEIQEELLSEAVPEGAYFINGPVDQARSLGIDQIFEGPALKHGFIDDEELAKAGRLKFIRVSDLIRVIMDVEGVQAVKSIQIANRPQDNDAGIPSRAVKWCLELAYPQGYIPRLSIEDSKLRYYKGLIPFKANEDEVEDILKTLNARERTQKIYYPPLDLPVPEGTFLGLDTYTSVQEEFPLTYGIGPEGIPGLGALSQEERKNRVLKARQLKGYLMLYDQVIYNTLVQLSHVKDLFSMNGEKDASGNYVLDKTYFSGSLENIVPDATPLYTDLGTHAAKLQEITEGSDDFAQRRNRFLDHLMARFSETFADYALLAGKLYGAKAPQELVEDKLQFLSKYPELSAGRGKAMNYQHPSRIWHPDNVSGLEKRASLLLGIAPKPAAELEFSDHFRVVFIAGNQYQYQIWNDSEAILQSLTFYSSTAEAKEGLELAILSGLYRERYIIADSNHQVDLYIEGTVVASSDGVKTFTAESEAVAAVNELMSISENEYLNNPESNRHNLACPLENYIYPFPEYDPDNFTGDTFEWKFALYDQPFGFNGTEKLSGTLQIPIALINDEQDWRDAISRELWKFILRAANKDQYESSSTSWVTYDGQNYPEANRFVLHDIYGNAIGCTPDADEQALEELTQFIYHKFFIHEGMHLIEHTLLRPRVCAELTVPLVAGDGKKQLALQKQLLAPQRVVVAYTHAEYGVVKVEGDITGELRNTQVRIQGSSHSDGLYRINFFQRLGEGTILELRGEEPLQDSKVTGELTYWKAFEIKEVDLETAKVKVLFSKGVVFTSGQQVILIDEDGEKKTFVVEAVEIKGLFVELTLGEHIMEVHDALFPIHLDQDCEACQQEDVYSCVATVVLPYWPGRFPNMEMRRFTERTLRLEAPAHILLNICWISCADMHQLERKYKKWLLEISRKQPDLYQQSIALKELIEALTKVRNVYPHGVLHDCESDETYEGAIILNQTFLGTF